MVLIDGVTKLGLGTVQFGLPYGIANERGQVPEQAVGDILIEAHAAGIRVLDTAIAYGTSEAALGGALRRHEAWEFKVVSKLPRETRAADVPELVSGSLERLGLQRLYGFLLHDVETYRREPEILQALSRLRAAGLVQAIGVSVYTPEALAALLDEGAEVDLVQLPFNVFDRRFAPMLRRLKAAGVEVHARSAFLQGLFFLDPERLPPFFAPVRERLVTLRALAARHELPLAALPLGFALAQPDIDTVVVGVDGLANLRENLALAARLPDLRPLLSHIEELEVRDEDILLPYRWKNS